MVHAATHVENDTVSEMEVASCSKDEVKKMCARRSDLGLDF